MPASAASAGDGSGRRQRAHGPQVVTKHGEEVAVVVSIDDYRRLTEELPGLKEFLLAAPDLEALEVVGEIRQGVERLRRRDPTRVAP
ncbi:MAG TPA: type II toxin-antitoxin system prevent-host-death family antitoxin [Actinomycetota bacterium]|jgi:PHD/YefM family antitoxin component YafN of YafNO toxin-antitoxin module|nr:type II toxin-antitoxin system prevent-host-death family antitoxin [Actinomycetota bacterium]